jgi:DNA-binding beta-propeller fold protein YncE
MDRREFLAATTAAVTASLAKLGAAHDTATATAGVASARHRLYIAVPGIRNYLEYGGIGVLVYDIGKDYAFVKRIPTWDLPPAGKEAEVENVKGIAASARTHRLYVTTIKRIGCIDLLTEKMVWERKLDGGCDRLAIAPDGATLYVPSLEGVHWNVLDANTGDTITTIVTNSGAHNTVWGLDGTRVYLAGLRSPLLSVADARTHTVIKTIGPFGNSIRPFTINAAQTRCYVNVNELLGFEIGDLTTGKMLSRVEVKGYEKGPVKRHGCPSHGVGLTPDEREIWLCDGHNSVVHIFDNTVMPPRQIKTLTVRDQPGWVTFSLDGRHAYPSTGEVFDTKTKQRIAALKDEQQRDIGSEKVLELVFDGNTPIQAGDQFGVGMKSTRSSI